MAWQEWFVSSLYFHIHPWLRLPWRRFLLGLGMDGHSCLPGGHMGIVGWEMAGDTLSRLYISLAFPFLLLFFWFPSRWVTRFGPSLGGPGDEATFLVSFLTDAAAMVWEARRFLAAGGALFSDHILFLFCSLPQKYIFESGTRRTERNRFPRVHTFGSHFPEFGSPDVVGVSLVYPHSIRYPVCTLIRWTASQYEIVNS